MVSKNVKLFLAVILLGSLMLQYRQFCNDIAVRWFQTPSKVTEYGDISNKTPLKSLEECPPVTIHMVKNITIDMGRLNNTNQPTIKNVNPGGRYSPPNCKSKHRVAIIIPYRDRLDTLRILLRYMHPYLQKRHIEYGIFVVEQTNVGKFNKAMMMNTGFVEASKVYNYNCFIFHDADLLPENDGIPYTCEPSPLHLAVAVNTFKYQLFYRQLFGGVTGFTPEHFKKVNGFSNLYFGWGAEDDEMFASYQILKSAKHRKSTDGLNSLKFHVVKRELRSLYTWMLVSINETEIMDIGTVGKSD